MKKIIITLCLILLCILNVKAEKKDNALDSDSIAGMINYLGINIGYIIDNPQKMNSKGNDMYFFKGSQGIEIEGIYHLQFSRYVFLEPGVGLYYKKMLTQCDFYNKYMKRGHIDIKGMNMSLNVGLSKRYHKCFFFVKTGPEMDLGLNGKETAKFLNTSGGGKISQDAYKSLNRLNLLWNIGVGVSERRVTMGVDCAFGLTNFVNKYDFSARNEIIKYYFGFKF